MAAVVDILSKDNPLFSAYAFYSAVLILKMLAMSALTAQQRFRKKVGELGCREFGVGYRLHSPAETPSCYPTRGHCP
jgi:hypothetical protein